MFLFPATTTLHNDDSNKNGLLLYGANCSMKKTQGASTHHLCKYTHIRTHNLCTKKEMVCLNLWKGLLKKESFELNFEIREGDVIPHTARQ